MSATRTTTDWRNNPDTRRAYDAGHADGTEAGVGDRLADNYSPDTVGEWSSLLADALPAQEVADLLAGCDYDTISDDLWDMLLLAYSAGCQDGYGSVQS